MSFKYMYGYSTLDCVYMYSFMCVVFILCNLIFHDSLYFVTKCDWQLDNKRFIIISSSTVKICPKDKTVDFLY